MIPLTEDRKNRWGGEKKENKKRMQFYSYAFFVLFHKNRMCVIV